MPRAHLPAYPHSLLFITRRFVWSLIAFVSLVAIACFVALGILPLPRFGVPRFKVARKGGEDAKGEEGAGAVRRRSIVGISSPRKSPKNKEKSAA
jgi:hypothetical protein